jgi:hypothetical protein
MSTKADTVFPRDVRIRASLRLATWHPRGVLDAPLAREILAFVEAREAAAPEPFHRFIDFSALDAIHLSFADVEELAQRRIESYHGAPVKSAILALNPLAFGIARMYEHLMRRSPIEVRVFCRISSAATWLKMPTDVLVTER